MIGNYDFENFKIISGKENLSHIFDWQLNTFESVSKPTVIGNISLYDLLTKIRYNFLDEISISDYTTQKYIGGVLNPIFTTMKSNKRTVAYNATFNGYMDSNNLISPTNLMFLDIDGFKSKDEALEYKEMITKKYNWIVSCNLSLSRLGLHVIILVDEIKDNEDFKMKYQAISTMYFQDKLDPNAKGLSRHTIIPNDFGIYINENPETLMIDYIINKLNKISVVDNDNSFSKIYNNKEKSTRSVHKKIDIIPTAYTFSSIKDIEEIINVASRVDGLRFEETIDESIFIDHDIPLYIPEGVKVIEVNLFPYRNGKVNIGNRNNTIGGISMRMIYINTNRCTDKPDEKKKKAILKFMLNLNKAICDPPLAHNEVVNSVLSNWEKYVSGELDVSKLYKIKRSFWSKQCKLRGREKTKVTFKIKNEPIVAESKQKIYNAIEMIYESGEKVTQEKVAKITGQHKQTVKKYWSEYKQFVNGINSILKCK